MKHIKKQIVDVQRNEMSQKNNFQNPTISHGCNIWIKIPDMFGCMLKALFSRIF